VKLPSSRPIRERWPDSNGVAPVAGLVCVGAYMWAEPNDGEEEKFKLTGSDVACKWFSAGVHSAPPIDTLRIIESGPKGSRSN
jgi:hypothetical protein